VLNQTEALVAIDVNSGRATREHHIEDTALKTNLEASEEIARQLRLRDLAGLIVIDFIDMDEKRNNRSVERRLKECLKNDRARIQVGRISHFGLLEMSRQRIRSGVLESSTDKCPHCGGTGHVRSVASVSLQLLRMVEDSLLRGGTHNLVIRTRTDIALYVLNHKRAHLRDLEERFRITISVNADAGMAGQQPFLIEKGEQVHSVEQARAIAQQPATIVALEPEEEEEVAEEFEAEEEGAEALAGEGAEDAEAAGAERGEHGEHGEGGEGGEGGGRRRRRRRRRGRRDNGETFAPSGEVPADSLSAESIGGEEPEGEADEGEDEETHEGSPRPQTRQPGGTENGNGERRRRRRGRRGGRRNRRPEGGPASPPEGGYTPIDDDVAHAAADFGGPLLDDGEPEPAPRSEEARRADTRDEPRFEPDEEREGAPTAERPPEQSAEAGAEPAPQSADSETPRRRSTVREPVSIYVEGSEPATAAPHALPAPEEPPAPATPPAPAGGETEEQPDRPRRTGWWSRR